MATTPRQPVEGSRKPHNGYPLVGTPAGTPLGRAPKATITPQSRYVRVRDIVVAKMFTALLQDFVKHGESAIVACRLNKPEAYLKLIADSAVKRIAVDVNTTSIIEILSGMAHGQPVGDEDIEGVFERVGERRSTLPRPAPDQ